jgi:hypothetical protein
MSLLLFNVYAEVVIELYCSRFQLLHLKLNLGSKISGSHGGMKMTALWDTALCSLAEIDQHFRGAYCLHHQVIALMVETVHNSEISVCLFLYMAPYLRRLSSSS